GLVSFTTPITVNGFAEALDSLGGFDQQFDSIDDSSIFVAASTGLANANAGASAFGRTGSVGSGVNLSEMEAFGAFTARSSIFGTFQITGATGPVSVTFQALVNYTQSLMTAAGGVSGTSEIAFNLNLDNGDTPLFLDNILQIGPNSTSSTSANP